MKHSYAYVQAYFGWIDWVPSKFFGENGYCHIVKRIELAAISLREQLLVNDEERAIKCEKN